ncbi:unnamed protein product [Diatraea saccharalis]|uniref:Uncharacterized protein n=1 Tax=Diatraea saccharalis TaxID=40085 RepID=A0A9N9R1Q5_9NEOP|nr:unnamed protein product [Diatraea saccharalis]
MSSTFRNPSFNSSSGASSHFDSTDDMETTKLKNYARDLIKSRIFLGRYVERRLINQGIGYRDIVLLSAAEVELKKDLYDILHKFSNVSPNLKSIGIIDAEVLGVNSSGLCIWTEIENQPFGPFWFQIKGLKFRSDEIMVSVKCVRHISEAYLEIEPILVGAPKKSKESLVATLDSSAETLGDTYNDIVAILKDALSIRNVKEFVTFIFALVIAVFTGTTTFVNFLGNFVLALIREISFLVKNSTPMFLGLLDFFSKIVGGFYILLAMFFKPNNPPPHNRNIRYYDQRHPQVTSYDDKQFD